MLLVSTDWVLPISRQPLRDAGVLVDDERIVAVDSTRELLATAPDAEHRHFPGCVMTPGLVNAHTHLTLSALSGVVPPAPFAKWLPHLVAALKPWDVADHEASGIIGAEQCLLAGVTVVGDIAYGAAEVASASRAGLGGVYYWELLGMEAKAVPSALRELRYPPERDAFGDRVTCGLSPHSPYTAGPGLLRAVHDEARARDVPVAVHVAESQAEVELLRDGTGPLAGVASRTAFGFEAPGTSTVRYLADLGVLDRATAVHVCYLTEGDAALLAGLARGAVTCPRSNRYLDNPPPAIAPLLDAGVAMGVGTDSSASNHDLDLLAEVRAIRGAEPHLSSQRLLELATLGGATAIGVENRFGSLSPGKSADMALFRIGATEDPTTSTIASGGCSSTEAVMSGGCWRVLGGALLERDPKAATRAADARERSRTALLG